MRRIPLGNTAFEGNNNAYLFESREGTVLLDTGVSTPETREQLEDGLGAAGLAFGDIDHVLLTHWHQDHSGLAGEIQAASDATVSVHAADAALVEQDEAALAALEERWHESFEAWGMPEADREELLSVLGANSGNQGRGATVESFEDGARFDFGDLVLEAVHAPGHTAGLTCFAADLDGERVLFSGDAVLPVYTPNVGGADVRVERPLERYLDSLGRIAAADYDRAYPGHRDLIEDPTARAEYIIEHHEERSMRVLRALEDGPADTWTVSATLFGSLSSIHILHGPGEAHAHLAHLEREGTVEREGREYRLTAETRERLDELGERWPLERDST
jgi:glyoxylase-like metal-dependent hydrolase (beta-lactamase superfamily II)